MRLRIELVLGLIAAMAICPVLVPDLGSVRAQSDHSSSESSGPASRGAIVVAELIEALRGPLYPSFSQWATPEPVQSLNTSESELPMCISRDGLSLYFFRVDPVTDQDIYVVHRVSPEADWGVPVKLPNGVNSTAADRGAFLTADGLTLYFSSDRAGGMGGFDLYKSTRSDANNDLGWQQPVNLSTVNSPGFDSGPALLEDKVSGTAQLYFSCSPSSGGTDATADIYMSVLGPTGFEPPTPVTELNSPYHDARPYLRPDGREIFFSSERNGPRKVYRSWRNTTSQTWSQPVAITYEPNSGLPAGAQTTTPVLSWDGTTLYIGAWGPGLELDEIYVTHRTRVFYQLNP